MFVRKIYLNETTGRVKVTFEDTQLDPALSMFAMPSASEKFGQLTLALGTTLEQAQEAIAIGEDFSAKLAWGEPATYSKDGEDKNKKPYSAGDVIPNFYNVVAKKQD
jgi:hypothetical protein